MNNNCAQIFGLILLVITNIAIIISFATPYWLKGKIQNLPLIISVSYNTKLRALCMEDSCDLLFQKDFKPQSKLPEWFKATQGLMSVGLGLGMLALITAALSLCNSCNCKVNSIICGYLVLACISMAVGITVFGVTANKWVLISILEEKFSLGVFGWSFWVGIGASAMALFTSTIYCCIGRQDH